MYTQVLERKAKPDVKPSSTSMRSASANPIFLFSCSTRCYVLL